MMREIVVDRHSPRASPYLHAPAHPRKAAERLQRLRRFDTDMARRGDGGQRIHAVVGPHLLPPQPPEDPAPPRDFKAPLRIRFTRFPTPGHAEALHWRPTPSLKDSLHRGISAVGDDQSGTRHNPHEVVELALDRLQIGEDVCMIELQIVQYCSAGVVVHELRAFVEKSRVVLVSLDDEARRAGEPGGYREVEGHPADQEPWTVAGALEDPRQHGRRGGLAMGARDREDVPAAEHVLGKPLGPRNVAFPAIENRLHQRVAARDDVADDPYIGPQRELILAETFRELDAERRELLAHWRIDVRIAAGHAVARGLRDRRDAAHEGAANS